MIITNALSGGRIVTVETEENRIKRISRGTTEEYDLDAMGNFLIPGYIDVHMHGCMGFDTMDGRFDEICDYEASHGVTSFLPTLMTSSKEDTERVLKAEKPCRGAQILGFHLEGPFISKKRKGAQNESFIRLPDSSFTDGLDGVKMITLAPELDGAEEFIKNCGAVVSIGHTDCDYQTAVRAIDAGAVCLTHTCNAMPPFLHRDPGPIGAAFDKGIYAQVISDGLHLLPTAVLALYRLFGSDRMILISDSIRPSGTADGECESGGVSVFVRNGVARLSDGTLAGGGAALDECVRRAVSFGIPAEDAVLMASANPARLLGLKKGHIKEGWDADMLIVDRKLKVVKVIIGGKIYEPKTV